jgi:hypothetical protein
MLTASRQDAGADAGATGHTARVVRCRAAWALTAVAVHNYPTLNGSTGSGSDLAALSETAQSRRRIGWPEFETADMRVIGAGKAAVRAKHNGQATRP